MLDRSRVAIALVLLGACGGSRAAPPAPPETRPAPAALRPEPPPAQPVDGISLSVTPDDADVYIDDVLQGKAGTLPAVVALNPALHQLVITKDGYTSYRAEFSVVSGRTEAFTVRLERLAPHGP